MRCESETHSTWGSGRYDLCKGNIKIFCAVAAKEGWNIKSNDVTCAFLQGAPIERDVFSLPPKERRIPRILWQLKKPVYGLAD